MKIHIVCYEDVNTWIIGKFALRMKDNLHKMGIETNISDTPDMTADINHHLVFNAYNGKKTTIDSLMITHIDSIFKLNLLRNNMETALAGICMSKETMEYLVKMGINKEKLCYINPAHDGNIPIKKIRIGIASRIYDDGRKNEFYFDKLANKLNPVYFNFKIMGNGWESQVKKLQQNKFDVDYIDHFDYERYLKFILDLDYYLYTGFDEGQMGFIDALSAGIKTIVAPQGYHLDAENGITYPFTNYEELENILLNLQEEKHRLVQSVASWNWYDYTLKHIEIWKYLLGEKNIKSAYVDGLNAFTSPIAAIPLNNSELLKQEKKLIKQEKRYLKKAKRGKFKKILMKNGFFGFAFYLFSKIMIKIYNTFNNLTGSKFLKTRLSKH